MIATAVLAVALATQSPYQGRGQVASHERQLELMAAIKRERVANPAPVEQPKAPVDTTARDRMRQQRAKLAAAQAARQRDANIWRNFRPSGNYGRDLAAMRTIQRTRVLRDRLAQGAK